MHPELRAARSLYDDWRHLPDVERVPLTPLAREVKELALDLRGRVDAAAAEHDLAEANIALEAALRGTALRRAA